MSECWVCDMFSHQIVFIILPLALLILSVLLSCIFDSFSDVLYPHDALFLVWFGLHSFCKFCIFCHPAVLNSHPSDNSLSEDMVKC